MKKMKIVPIYLFLHLFVAGDGGGCGSQVFTDVNNVCYQAFFVGSSPPTGLTQAGGTYKYICQQLNGDTTTTYFATMFDKDAGIPVYSAYVVRSADAANIGTADRKGIKWRTEPALGLGIYTKQGNDETYQGQVTFQKGHLLPVGIYSFSKEHIISTFTYTNAVPQIGRFNEGIWANYETKIREYAEETCGISGADLYVITGVTMFLRYGDTVDTTLKRTDYLKNKIRVPRSMWSAGCCVAQDGTALSNFAVIGNNLLAKNRVKMTEVTVKELQALLLKDVNTGSTASTVELFPGKPDCAADNLNVQL